MIVSRQAYQPPVSALPGVKTLVSPKSEKDLPTGIDREKERALPPGAATPNSPSEEGGGGSRELPKYEFNRPDNDLPERPRTLSTPGEEYDHPTKFDYNMPTRRDMTADVDRVVEAYQRRWRPGKRQRKKRGPARQKQRMYYRKNRNKIKQRAKIRYQRTKRNPQFQRVQQHRRKHPGQHQRRYASLPSPILVASLYLKGADWNPPKRIPPPKRQRRQRGQDKIDDKKNYLQNRAEKIREMSKRHKKLMKAPKYRQYKEWYNEQYREKGGQGFRRRGYVLTTPQIEFVIGREMVPGVVHNVSPMTGMVTFVVREPGWEHLHSMAAVAFMESAVFLSENDIDAFFDLVDVEIGLEAYQDIDEGVVRECAAMFDIDPDVEEFADRCEALTGQAELGSMTSEQLGLVNDVLVTGYMEGGHTRDMDLSSDEDSLYNEHLIYGEVESDPGKKAGIILLYDQENPKQEIEYPGSNLGYRPSSPSHYQHSPDEKEGLPHGNALPDQGHDHADSSTSRVQPHGQFIHGSRTAATIDEIAMKTGPDVHGRAKQVVIRLRRADPKRAIWTFQAQGSKGRTYTIRIKGLKKGNVRNLNKAQVQISCTCDFFRWQGPEHWAKSNSYLYGRPRGTATSPNIKDPSGRHWACKHALAALLHARRFKFGSEDIGGILRTAEIVPDFDWADEWGGSVVSVTDRFLSR